MDEPEVYEYKKLTYQGKTIFGKIVMGKFDRIEKYFTEKEACFMFVNNGDMILRTPNNTIHIKDGDGLFAKCGNYFFEQQTSEQITLVAAYFYPEVITQIFSKEEVLSSTFETSYDAKRVVIDQLLKDYKRSLGFLLDNPEVVDDSLLLTKLKEFIILLSKSENAPSVIDFISSFFKPFEYNFKTIIENNLLSNLSLLEFSVLCGMSLATFKRKFKEYYDTSPKQYVMEGKILHATKLLQIKENRIVDIAYDCGFDTITAFNRNFKKLKGKTPTEYRRSS